MELKLINKNFSNKSQFVLHVNELNLLNVSDHFPIFIIIKNKQVTKSIAKNDV